MERGRKGGREVEGGREGSQSRTKYQQEVERQIQPYNHKTTISEITYLASNTFKTAKYLSMKAENRGSRPDL